MINGPDDYAAEWESLKPPAPPSQPLALTVDQRVATYHERAVQAGGNDPLPWIRRGRWHVERGETEKADADFAQAGRRTPGELNKFLETGWWVLGPYSADLQEPCPPEYDTDPARPCAVVDLPSGRWTEPTTWQRVPSGRWGRVSLPHLP